RHPRHASAAAVPCERTSPDTQITVASPTRWAIPSAKSSTTCGTMNGRPARKTPTVAARRVMRLGLRARGLFSGADEYNAPMPEFLPIVRRWFAETFSEATRPQREGWEAIASQRDTLIVAPTGSGKTLAAFLWALDHLHRLGLEPRLEDRGYVVYVSPLRALNNDIEKNLRAPLAGIRAAAAADGLKLPEVRVAVRTGDTLAAAR